MQRAGYAGSCKFQDYADHEQIKYFQEKRVQDWKREQTIKQIQKEDEEAAKELEKKFSRRQLGSNADRYKEEEPELDSDGKLHLGLERRSQFPHVVSLGG